ncbi:MAG: hypothetical protein QW279_16470, partial [Candidatus Jordarchaeaceae archaeon]
GNDNTEIMRLLEATGRIVREKNEGESGLKILEKIIPIFNFSSTPVREEAIKIIEKLKDVWRAKS